MKNFSLPLEIPVKSFREIRDGLKSPETRGRAVSNLLVYLAGALLSFAVIFGAGYYFMAVTASGVMYDSFADSAYSSLNGKSGLAKLVKNGDDSGLFGKEHYYRLDLPFISTTMNLTAVTSLGLFNSSTEIVLQNISVGSDIPQLNLAGGRVLASFDLDFSSDSPAPANVKMEDIKADDGSRSLVISGISVKKCSAGDESCSYLFSASELTVRDSSRDVSYSLRNVQLPIKISDSDSGESVAVNKGVVASADLRLGKRGSFSAAGLRISGVFSNKADSLSAEKVSISAKQAKISLEGMQQGELFDFDQRFVVKGSVRNGGNSFMSHLSDFLEPVNFSDFTIKEGPFNKASAAAEYFRKNRTFIEIKQLQAVSGDATTTSDFTLSNGYADFEQDEAGAELLFKKDFLANFSSWNDTVSRLLEREYIKNSADAPGYITTTIRYVRGNVSAGDRILYSK